MTPVVVSRVEHAYRLHRNADKYVPKMADAFVASAQAAQWATTEAAVAEAMRRPGGPAMAALLDTAGSITIAKAAEAPKAVVTIYAQIIAGAAIIENVQATPLSPHVLRYARDLSSSLVTNVTEETRAAVRWAIHEAIREGKAPAVAHRAISNLVGLTRRDASRLWRLAETANTTELTVERARMLKRRGMSIARTETITASSRGQQAAWHTLADDGLIDRETFRRIWTVTPDDRLCELCAPMDGMTISLDESYESTQRGVLPSDRKPYDGDTVDGPTLHTACRCIERAEFE